ncbi:hypothetical protein AB0B50_20145 [Streptomyces sp. NPDC041068]|uniref:hypothetical protein n=1 Tax=Streptomyces sp. NPDC041068 TaxID=3155130 RepID=UPI0033EEDCE4
MTAAGLPLIHRLYFLPLEALLTRMTRALCTLHGVVLVWLAYCTVQSARNGAAWAVLMFGVTSAMSVIAVVRETEPSDRVYATRQRARVHQAAEDDARILAEAQVRHDRVSWKSSPL